MMYRLPDREEIAKAARDVLRTQREVNSLAQMHRLVLKRLKKKNRYYRVSKARLLKILATAPGVRIRVEKRKARQSPRLCPLCGSPLEDLHGIDLFGNRVKLGKRCTDCGYRVERRLEPRRYIFYI